MENIKIKNDEKLKNGQQGDNNSQMVLMAVGIIALILVMGGVGSIISTIIGGIGGIIGFVVGMIGTVIGLTVGLVGGIIGLAVGLVGVILAFVFGLAPFILLALGVVFLARVLR